jgi:uncharacterized protein (DUF1697 family)
MAALAAVPPERQPKPAVTRYAALLRAINVGKRQLPMADLRALAARLGLEAPETYIASGNLIFSSERGGDALAVLLETEIAARFGFKVDVVIRSAAEWAAHAASNPFPDAAAKMLHLCVTRRTPAPDASARIGERLTASERVAVMGGAIWIDFGQAGVAGSKLTPAFLDKAAGSPLTARNWNTVQVIARMLGA